MKHATGSRSSRGTAVAQPTHVVCVAQACLDVDNEREWGEPYLRRAAMQEISLKNNARKVHHLLLSSR